MYLWIINGILTNYHQQNTFSIHELHLVRHICKEYVHWVADIYWDLRASRESHVSRGSIRSPSQEFRQKPRHRKDLKVPKMLKSSRRWCFRRCEQLFLFIPLVICWGWMGVYIYIYTLYVYNQLRYVPFVFFFHYRILITCRWGKISDLSWFIAIV